MISFYKASRSCYCNKRRTTALLRQLTWSTCIALLMTCGSWCGVVMAQTGDGGSALQVRVRIFLEAPLGTAEVAPLAVRVQHVDSVLRLRSGSNEATTQVQVVIYVANTAAELTMTLFVDDAEVATVPSDPIVIAAAGNAMRRTAQFTLTAKEVGEAIVFIAVADGVNNVTVALRVVVRESMTQPSLAVIEPRADTVLQLLSRGAEATTQVQVVIDATDSAAELRMTLSVDVAGAEVVVVPSIPIVIVATDDATRRSAEFALMAKKAGTATVLIAVTDGASTDTVALRVVVMELPHTLAVIEPQPNTELQLMSRGAEATTQMQVVIDATDSAAELTMTISTDAAGAEVVSVPSEPIVIVAMGDAMRRSTEFALMAKKAGTATVLIAVTDGASTDTVALRVVVLGLPHTLAVIEPRADTELRLLSRGTEVTTQVQVVADATDSAAELKIMLSVDAAGAEVVSVPSEPIVIVAMGDAMRRSAEFTLTAKKAGTSTVTIVVTDGASTDTVALRVIVMELPHTLAVIEPQADTELRLFIRETEVMTQVQVVVDATNTASTLTMTISTDGVGAEVVVVPSEPIAIAAEGNAMQRTAQFELTTKTTGTATVTIAATDGVNTATVVLRVVVADLLPLQILSPSDDTQIALVRGDRSTAATQVEVFIVQPNTGVPVALSVQLDRIAMPSVFISTTSLTLTASADGSTRTRFTVAAAEAGNTTLTLVASDSLGNRAAVSVRVSVARLSELCESCLVPDMLTVSTGTFTMGSPAKESGRDADEGPQHQISIGYTFAVGQYELTHGQYRAFVDASGYAADSSWLDPGFTQSNAHPVVSVSWEDAKAYLVWLSEETGEEWRLLSEAEWEYAARAGTTTSYSFGNTINATQARFDSSDGTVAVGSYPANAFGLHDMHGNVWEWVEDCLHNNYNGAPIDGSAWLSECDEDGRVLRGGSWRSLHGFLRSANRAKTAAKNRFPSNGFRVARTLKP